ncbi:MAG TPA: carbon storage regulator [Phycisphaerae bacterium]|jgi:carbon storage regulator|nr:carbon storage regulator [Phycisphaerae bacterium]HWB96805.1 carbon storage regulator [Bryobacteraceae bacterium]
MLIFSRKPGESFVIGKDIEVVIFGFDNQYVKVGVRAPRHIPILRKELQDVEKQNTMAMELPSAGRLQDLSQKLNELRSSRNKGR